MFGHPGGVVLAPFGPNTHPRRRIFQHFWGNGALAKIMLPLWWGHNFEGSDPQKIGPESDCERHARKKSKENASNTVCDCTFSVPGTFSVAVRVPRGFPQDAAQSLMGRSKRSHASDPRIIASQIRLCSVRTPLDLAGTKEFERHNCAQKAQRAIVRNRAPAVAGALFPALAGTPRVCAPFELSVFPGVRLAQAAVKGWRTSQRCLKEAPETCHERPNCTF